MVTIADATIEGTRDMAIAITAAKDLGRSVVAVSFEIPIFFRMENSYNPGGYGGYGTPAYAAPGMAPGNVPPATNANPGTGTGSSSGTNPTGLSPGSGTAGSSSGSNPAGLSGGSGRSPSGAAVPGNSTAGTSSNANSSAGGKSGM